MATIVDQYGRVVEPDKLKGPPVAGPTFHGIRNIYSIQHPSIGLTPERLAAILLTAETGDPLPYLELAEDMEEKDLHYLSVMSTRRDTVAQLEVTISPAGKDAQSVADADFAREVLLADGGIGLQSTFADMLDATGKGFSVSEIMWGAGKEWIPERIVWRQPKWFQFDWISGEQVLVRTWRNQETIGSVDPWSEAGWDLQYAGISGERSTPMQYQPATAPLTPYKFISYIAKAKSGLPIRGGLARAVAWIYLFKNYVIKDAITYAERYGMPSRVGKYAAGAEDEDKERLLVACQKLGSDSAAIIPDSMVIEYLEASAKGGKSGTSLYLDLLRYFDDAMSKAVLGQTLTTELPSSGGSRAAAEVHDNVRKDILAWDALRLSQAISRDLVRPLVHLNRGERKRYPIFVLKIMTRASKEWVDSVMPLVDRGLEVSAEEMREKLGLRKPVDGEEVLEPMIKVPAPGAEDDGNEPPPTKGGGKKPAKSTQAFDPDQPRVPAGDSEGGRWTSEKPTVSDAAKMTELIQDEMPLDDLGTINSEDEVARARRQLRERAVKAVGERVAASSVSDEDLSAFTRSALGDLRGDVPAIQSRAEMAEFAAKRVIDKWVGTSGDSVPEAVAFQLAVESEFDIKDPALDHFGSTFTDGWAYLKEKPGAEPVMRAVARATYENTQAWLEERGVTEVSAFRGMMLVGKHPSEPLPKISEGWQSMKLQPISSFSANPREAIDFASDADSSLVLGVRVPAKDVFSLAATGLGSQREQEVIILGGDRRGFAVSTARGPSYLNVDSDKMPKPNPNKLNAQQVVKKVYDAFS